MAVIGKGTDPADGRSGCVSALRRKGRRSWHPENTTSSSVALAAISRVELTAKLPRTPFQDIVSANGLVAR